jgi:glucose/arabinose dehydrogenase
MINSSRFGISKFVLWIILFLGFSPLYAKMNALANAPVSIPLNIKFEVIASGLSNPLFITHAGDASGRIFIVERNGKIHIYRNGVINDTPFLDVSDIINATGGEQGLLGLAFDPSYEVNGKFYIVYTILSNNAIRLARFNVSDDDPDLANPSGTTILTIDKNSTNTNHNGGVIAFGPDGYLYMSTGDGGGRGDPNNNAQNKNILLGKILRLDVSGDTYAIPPTNPFVGDLNVKEEIWAYGLRNPWRFSFDRATGDLYIGDVGQGTQEEINFQSSSSLGGENYGWHILEGNLCYASENCAEPGDYTPPVTVYDHGVDNMFGCSVTGGYVYRGTNIPSLVGIYLFGDFCEGKLWGMTENENGDWIASLITDTDFRISSFGEDESGEIYLTDYSTGRIIRITEAEIVQKTFLSEDAYDGFILESSENSNTGSSKDEASDSFALGDNSENRQYRAILSFNTAGLPDNAVIVSAKLRIKEKRQIGGNPFNSHGYLAGDIYMGNFGNNPHLESIDFSTRASKNNVVRFTINPINAWYTKSVNSVGLSYINKSGNTQFRLRFVLDDDNDYNMDVLRFFSGNNTSSKSPRLIIQYYLP